MNKEVIIRDIGRLLQILSVLFLVSAGVTIVLKEFFATPAFVLPGIGVYLIGHYLNKTFIDSPQPTKVDSMIIAALGWLLISLLGSLPFWISFNMIKLDLPLFSAPELIETMEVYGNPLNGFFESTAGFTGTGLTVTLRESQLPASLQWWRSFTQWIGGVGVIVLTTAILERPGSGSFTLYESEARSKKIHPSIVSTVRSIWWIISAYTILSIIIFYLVGMPLWDSINHAMTGITTGGFSVTDNSLATYNNALIELAAIPIMILGGISFVTHYSLLKYGKIKEFIKDIETKYFLYLIIIGSLLVFISNFTLSKYSNLSEVLRTSIFQFVSAISCTGFQTATNLGSAWPITSYLFLFVAMIIGGVAGSTAGGIKTIRALTLFKGIKREINNLLSPKSAINKLKIGKRNLYGEEASNEILEATIITFLWISFLFLGTIILSFTLPTNSFSLENIAFEVISAQGNVGLSTGITGPNIPSIAKISLIFNMWIGRLEIIPVVIFFKTLLKK